jgi:pimeloyl-ACP methyl ester carboxylesterase
MSTQVISEIPTKNSTNVRTELTRQEFMLRAFALRWPWHARAARATDLFCSPMPGTRARALQAALGAFTGRTIRSLGVDYQAYVLGNPAQQPYVLCAHGWSSFGLRFAPWAQALQQAGYAMVSFDHIAHGRSSGTLATLPGFIAGINAMRQSFGEPAACVGHSFGAAALACAAAENALLAPLVLVAPPADLMVAVRYFVRKAKLPDTMIAAVAKELSRRTGRDLQEFRAKFSAGNVHQALLVIHDVADDEVSWNAGAQYAMLAPNAKLLSSTGLGHHRILNHQSTIDAALAHFRGDDVGAKLLVSDLDLQDVLGF